jgi:RNA recognition motif-containing protein
MDIYIGNIFYEIDEPAIRKIFEVFGKVTDVVLIRDKRTQTSIGYGFVQMPNAIEASRAITELDGHALAGRNLVVKIAHPKDQKLYLTREESNKTHKLPADKTLSESTGSDGYSKKVTDDGYVKLSFKS